MEIHNINKQLAYLGSYYNSLKMTMKTLIAHKKCLKKQKRKIWRIKQYEQLNKRNDIAKHQQKRNGQSFQAYHQ